MSLGDVTCASGDGGHVAAGGRFQSPLRVALADRFRPNPAAVFRSLGAIKAPHFDATNVCIREMVNPG